MGRTITEKVLAFQQRPSARTLYRAVRAVARQGRGLELAYGLGQLIWCKPAIPARRAIPAEVALRAERMRGQDRAGVLRRYRSDDPLLDRWIPDVPIRAHSVARCGKATVVGEYCEAGPRLFLLTADRLSVCERYRRESGVRHIHFVHALDDRRFLVSTGDSKRVLDLWRIEDGELRFERRLMRRLAGFTAAATVSGETYLGSDFSNRPNYLLRLRDRRKFFLPAEAFRSYVWLMEPVQDRYLIVGSRMLAISGGTRFVSIFDAALESFVEPC